MYLGRFINEARSTVEEFKGELIPEEIDGAQHAIKDIKEEVRQLTTGRKTEEETRPSSRREDRDEPATASANANRD